MEWKWKYLHPLPYEVCSFGPSFSYWPGSSILTDDPVTKHASPLHFFVVQAPNSIWGTLLSHYLSLCVERSLHPDFEIGSGNSDRVKQMVAPGMEILSKCTQISLSKVEFTRFFPGAIKES